MNFKNYPEALGAGAYRIASALLRLGSEAGVAIAAAPSATDISRLARFGKVPVVAQHVDPVDPGAHTGYLPPEAVRAVGGLGSLVNHSEHPEPDEIIRATVHRLDRLGLVPVVCAPDAPSARRLAAFYPKYLAVEPPELIGGTRSVSTARPEVVTESVNAVGDVSPSTRVLCGAGVHDRTDVRRALELGSAGVLVASAVVRAKDPTAAIAELLAGF